VNTCPGDERWPNRAASLAANESVRCRQLDAGSPLHFVAYATAIERLLRAAACPLGRWVITTSPREIGARQRDRSYNLRGQSR